MSTSETQTNLASKLGPVLFLLAVLLAPHISQHVSNPVQISFMAVSEIQKSTMSTSETQSNLTAKLPPVLFLLAVLLAPHISQHVSNPVQLSFMAVSEK